MGGQLWGPTGVLPTASAWTPASLGSALIAWYKADAGVYSDSGITLATNGQSVQQWNDQSGNGYHLRQTTVGQKPTYLTNTLNGLPVLDFNNALNNQCFQTISQNVVLGGTTASGFILSKVTSNANGSSNARVLGISIPGGGDIDPTTAIFEYFPGSTITNPTTYNSGNKSSGTITASSWNQVGSIFDGANDTMYIANAGQTPVAATPTFASPVIIDVFCDGGLGISPTGQAAEIIITNTALSSTDRTNLASYLTARWGI